MRFKKKLEIYREIQKTMRSSPAGGVIQVPEWYFEFEQKLHKKDVPMNIKFLAAKLTLILVLGAVLIACAQSVVRAWL
jgi:hypothetical protein